MQQTDVDIKSVLSRENEEFKRLQEKHHQYEDKLNYLHKLSYLTLEQQRQEAELKKLKLKVKDEMEVLISKYRMSQVTN